MNKEQIMQKAYEKFKLLWCMQHGYTLKDVFCAVCDYNDVCDLDADDMDDDRNAAQIQEDWFDTWEHECGFGSEIYPCFNEFLETEFQDKNIRAQLLTPEELKIFGEYSYEVCGYDKDSDVYECFGRYEYRADAIAKLSKIAAMHKNKEIRRIANNEPFDWFDVLEIATDKSIATAAVESSHGESHVKITLW